MIAAVVPVKALAEAKSRLTPALSPEERRALVVELVARTVLLLRNSGLICAVALVTPDTSLGEELGVRTLPDSGTLNDSLVHAAAWAAGEGASGLLILPGDLPLLQRNDLHALLSLRSPGIAIAPTQDGGTGALFLRPPDAITPAFGEGSFRSHVDQALERGLTVRTVQRDGFTFDLDREEDLARWRRWGTLPITGSA